MKHITRNSTTKQTQEKYGDVSSSSLPPVSLQMLHQRVASFPWMEARHMIVLAEQTGMIENKVARAVLNEIEFGDGRILIHLFERAEGRFDCFLDLLSLKVYQIIGDYGEDDDSDERSLISQSSEF